MVAELTDEQLDAALRDLAEFRPICLSTKERADHVASVASSKLPDYHVVVEKASGGMWAVAVAPKEKPETEGVQRNLVRQHNELQRAAKLALSAIDEYLLGARIDWDDVRRVLARALGEVAK